MEAHVPLLCAKYPITYTSSEPNTVYPLHVLPSYFIKIHSLLPYHLGLALARDPFPLDFPHRNHEHVFLHPHMCHI